MKVLVSVGTHEQPFQRLLDAAQRAVLARPDDEWTVQYGVGMWTTSAQNVRVAVDYLDAEAMRQHLVEADVIVSQASPGTVFGALAATTWPIVLGRRVRDGEHVDDHQVRFARELDRTGLAHDLGDASLLVAALAIEAIADPADRRARCATAAARSAANARRFREDVWRVLQDVL